MLYIKASVMLLLTIDRMYLNTMPLTAASSQNKRATVAWRKSIIIAEMWAFRENAQNNSAVATKTRHANTAL